MTEEEKLKEFIVKLVDNEITDSEKIELNRLLEKFKHYKTEIEEMKKLKELSRNMKLKTPSSEVFDTYWTKVYNRIERGIAWIIFSIGAVILITYGLFKAVEELISDGKLETIVKIGIIGVLAGLVILIVSVIREKIIMGKTDKYKEVKR